MPLTMEQVDTLATACDGAIRELRDVVNAAGNVDQAAATKAQVEAQAQANITAADDALNAARNSLDGERGEAQTALNALSVALNQIADEISPANPAP